MLAVHPALNLDGIAKQAMEQVLAEWDSGDELFRLHRVIIYGGDSPPSGEVIFTGHRFQALRWYKQISTI